MKLQVKFKEAASQAEREQVVQALSTQGASDVRPLFPRATDPVRSSLYVVDATGRSEGPLLSFLQDADAVEFVEPEVRRKLAEM